MKSIVFACTLALAIQPAIAQTKSTTSTQQVWVGFFNQTRFSTKWGVWVDVHLRTREDFFSQFSQSILRAGLTYYCADATKLTIGYAYVSSYPADTRMITQPEHRPWQQVQWHTKYRKIRTMQLLRLEERYRRRTTDSTLAHGYTFNFRLRYNFLLQIPLSKREMAPHTLSAVVNNEIHINFGKQIVYNYFDQNRFFAGFGYQVNKTDNIQFGYMNVFQQLASGNRYRSIHAARVFYFQNLDLRKRK